jgi:hypothetical protein
MPDIAYWHSEAAREALLEKGRAAFERIRHTLSSESLVVAIEPESGAYYVGATLGKANDAAYEQHPDQWMYFRRVDDPGAEMILPTW